jgi:hypothetical protein
MPSTNAAAQMLRVSGLGSAELNLVGYLTAARTAASMAGRTTLI